MMKFLLSECPRARSLHGIAILALLAVVAGCGSNRSTAPVSGTVTHDGQPVSGGSLTFRPTGQDQGKPAAAEVGEDGTYSLTTYDTGDGAIPGSYMVRYSPDREIPEDLEPGESLPESPYEGLVPDPQEVEVSSGSNTIDIALVAQ